jgi:hypothetical protein
MTTTMPENQKTKLPQMQPDVGFGLGFFCGALLAAFGVYLAVSPDGKKLKARLTAEFNEHQRTLILASVLPHDKKTDSETSETAKIIRTWIKKIKSIINVDPVTPGQKTIHPAPKRKHHFKQK